MKVTNAGVFYYITTSRARQEGIIENRITNDNNLNSPFQRNPFFQLSEPKLKTKAKPNG